MTIVQQIKHWFENDQPYIIGVGLLRSIGHLTGSYESYFDAPWVPADVEKRLEHLLTEYFNQQHDFAPSSEVTPVADPEGSKANIVYVKKPVSDEPPEVFYLRQKAKIHHKLHASVFEKMKVATTDQERYAFAHQIMSEIIPTLDSYYDQIRAFEKEGTLPCITIGEVTIHDGHKYRRLNSLRPRISKLKKWLAGNNLNEKDRTKYSKELEKKQAELKQLTDA